MSTEVIKEEILGTSAVGDIFGVGKQTVSRWCREGKFPHACQDEARRPWHIPVKDVEALRVKKGVKK